MSKGTRLTHKGEVEWHKRIRDISKKVFNEKFHGILAQVIVKDVKEGLNTGKGTGTTAFKRLRLSTVKQKKKKGHTSKPLIATGTMRKLPPVKITSKGAEIAVAKSRSSIAMYHNEGMGNNPKREFFTISKRALRKIQRAVNKKMVHILRESFKVPNEL